MDFDKLFDALENYFEDNYPEIEFEAVDSVTGDVAFYAAGKTAAEALKFKVVPALLRFNRENKLGIRIKPDPTTLTAENLGGDMYQIDCRLVIDAPVPAADACPECGKTPCECEIEVDDTDCQDNTNTLEDFFTMIEDAGIEILDSDWPDVDTMKITVAPAENIDVPKIIKRIVKTYNTYGAVKMALVGEVTEGDEITFTVKFAI